jgi:hypothetical protein
MSASALLPTLSLELQAFVRIVYGALLLLTLGASLPHARRYFQSERWGGYAQSTPPIDAVQNPRTVTALLAVWFAAALGLVTGRSVLVASAVNVVLCYYFFIWMRWRGVLRGMGAPGFITFWLGAAVFLLELTARRAPAARSVMLLTLQIDFAAIMMTAGLYKLAAGYRHSHGMELGMVNPAWGYWPSFWQAWRPTHPLFRALDEMAWLTEVAGGVLMIVPATRSIGGAAILASFVFIATQIRLGFLCEMVIACCLLFMGGTAFERGLAAALPFLDGQATPGVAPLSDLAQSILIAGCWIYLLALPLVRAGLFYNQLRHARLRTPLQGMLDAYANVFGLILWRVFTADVVNFFVRIWEEPKAGARRLVSDYRISGPFRFSQVAECIALTSVFTTLKYYPGNRVLFETRLLRYARTIPRQPASRVVFEWVSVMMGADRFALVPIAEFAVSVDGNHVTDTILNDAASVHGIPSVSPVHEGARPGSYAPLREKRLS